MRGKIRCTERVFECPCCNTKQIAYKKSSKKTSEGHIKDMWCYVCKEERKMVQIRWY